MDAFSDLSFFSHVMKAGSLAAAAQELGVTPSTLSKRLAALERRLGVRLLHRTTRRISLTPEGETYLVDGARVLAELDELERRVTGAREQPTGVLKVAGTLGFGRRHVAPALSAFQKRFPAVDVQLHLADRPINLVEQGFDLQVRVGDLPDARLTARRIAGNRRLLLAAPDYLDRAGVPSTPKALAQHACIFIREGDEVFGTWHLSSGGRSETVKVRGPLSTNDGETALAWAIEGHGILMRSQWDAADAVRAGRLVPILTEWSPPAADVYAAFPTRSHLSAKTRALVDHLAEWFAPHRADSEDGLGAW